MCGVLRMVPDLLPCHVVRLSDQHQVVACHGRVSSSVLHDRSGAWVWGGREANHVLGCNRGTREMPVRTMQCRWTWLPLGVLVASCHLPSRSIESSPDPDLGLDAAGVEEACVERFCDDGVTVKMQPPTFLCSRYWRDASNRGRTVKPIAKLDFPCFARSPLGQKLEILSVRGEPISAVRLFPHLREVAFRETALQDISVLGEMKELRRIDLSGSQVKDLSSLCRLPLLQRLDASMTPLTRLPDEPLGTLTWLDIGGSPVRDLSPLSRLTALENLRVGNEDVDSLSFLRPLVRLEGLRVWGHAIADLAPLSDLRKLQWLGLTGLQLSDLEALTATDLRSLALGSGRVDSLAALERMPRLEDLALSRLEVGDLSPVWRLRGLKSLALREVDLRDLEPLAQLTNLRELKLSDVPVTDLRPLERLPNLETLEIDHQPIEL